MTQALSPEEIRRATEAVLDRPEFRPDAVETVTRSVLDWFLETLPQWAEANPELARVLIVVLTLLLVALLSHILYTVVQEFAALRRRAGAVVAGARSMAPLEEVGARNWKEAVALARAALDAGDLYRALWITHRCLLSLLDARDLVRFARWKTNGDYLGECRAGDPSCDVLGHATRAYESVVYAHDPISPDEAADLLDRVEDFAVKGAR